MDNPFFEHPILNSPYAYPTKHWELDGYGQPTQQIIAHMRDAKFVTPIPKPRQQQGRGAQHELNLDEQGRALEDDRQQYKQSKLIEAIRGQVDKWRDLRRMWPAHARGIICLSREWFRQASFWKTWAA